MDGKRFAKHVAIVTGLMALGLALLAYLYPNTVQEFIGSLIRNN